MKASFKFILAALAATAALAACTKETTPSFENDKVNPAAEGSRVIAVSFGRQTKTYLDDDGFQPKFNDRDSVLISNGKAIDTCEVSVDGDKATITTILTGALTAVYPYKAAKMSDSNPKQIDTVLVSTVQSGEFADANICMAVMENENDEVLSFKNKTALFCIKPPTGSPGYVEVIAAAGFNIANNIPTGSTHTSLDTIHVATTTADSVYVSILVPGNLTIGDLSFSDGTKVKTITEGEKASATVTLNTLYTVNGDNWAAPAPEVECVVIGGLKWATMNLGASTVNDYGNLYSWGNLNGRSGDSGYSPSFTSDNYSGTAGSKIASVAGWDKATHDAAYNELGGNWRMPSKGDFIALDIACGGNGKNGDENTKKIKTLEDGDIENGKVKQGKYWLAANQTVLKDIESLKGITAAGLLYSDGENYLFFPAAGDSYGVSRDYGGSFGNYWSSTWNSSIGAYALGFNGSDVFPQDSYFRYLGRSVRPVSD